MGTIRRRLAKLENCGGPGRIIVVLDTPENRTLYGAPETCEPACDPTCPALPQIRGRDLIVFLTEPEMAL